MSDDQQRRARSLLDPHAATVIGAALGPAVGPRADDVADDVIEALLQYGMSVIRPPRITLEDMVPLLRGIWAAAGGDSDPDAALRAVAAEMAVLISYRLGELHGARLAARRRTR